MFTPKHEYPDLPTLLEAIRRRPGMFLGRPTVYGLGMLLSGVEFAEKYHGVPEEARLGGFDVDGFEQWVAARYNPQQLSLRSYSLAERLAGSDAAGFELWFSWYDDYRTTTSGVEEHV